MMNKCTSLSGDIVQSIRILVEMTSHALMNPTIHSSRKGAVKLIIKG